MAPINVDEVLKKLTVAEKVELLAGEVTYAQWNHIIPLTWIYRHRLLAYQAIS